MIWFLTMILFLLTTCYIVLTLYRLSEFEVDRINPLDLCKTIERNVLPVIISSSATVFLSLFTLPQSLVTVALSGATLAYVLNEKKNRKNFFEPFTIIRDSGRFKKATFVGFVINFCGMLYSMVIAVLGITKSKH